MSVPGSASPLFLATAAAAAAPAGYQIDRSLRFNSADSAHLNRTPSSATNRQKWTWSGWVKRTSFGSRQQIFGAVTSGSVFGAFEFNADDELRFYDNTLGDSNAIVFETGRVFRDPSAWYHIVVALDSTAGTDAARIKVYVNGVQEESSSFSTGPTVSEDGLGLTNSTAGHVIGSWTPASSTLNLNAYLAEVHFVDGQQLAASDFGELDSNNVWQPKEFAGVHVGTTTTATGALPIRNTTGNFGATAASGFTTDANASNLFLALPLNTNTSDVSNSINSNSTTKTTTNQSTATSTTKSQFYGASSYWNANSDGILVAESGSELVLGTGDYTIELWFYDDSNHGGGGSGRCYLFDNRIGGSVVGDPPTITGYVDDSNHIRFGTSGGSTVTSSQGSGGTNNKWFHYAAVRSSGTCTLYINGNAVGSFGDTTNYTNNGIGIGRATDGGYGWAGYIQDFRIYKTAKYTSNFVPVGQNNSFYLKFADNSSNAALGTDSTDNSNTFTVNNLTAAGSAAVSVIDLDGNDSIEYPGPGDGISGDFTMECFFLMDSSASGFQRIFSTKESSYSDEQTMIRRKSDGNIQFYAGNSSPADHTGGSITSGVWHHAAIVRSGSTVSYYYDGSRLSTDTYSTSFDITKLVVGGGYGSENFNGDVHGARFTNGQALYSGTSYTVPTSAITTTSQGATASNVKVLAGTTSTVNENAGALGNGTSSGDPTATTAEVFGVASDMDSLLDTPTNYTAASGNNGGNYCTWNPLDLSSGANLTISNGNLVIASDNNNNYSALASFGMSSGKWYWEATCGTIGSYTQASLGINDSHTFNDGYTYYSDNGNKSNDGSTSSYGNSFNTAGTVIGIAFDAGAGTLTFYKNGVSQGVAFTADTTRTYRPFYRGAGSTPFSFNFGQRPFAYTPPTGYVSLCTQNLSESAYASIPDGSKQFDVDTWSGNGSDPRSRSLSFGPDLVWVKTRNQTNWNYVTDSVRGAPNKLYTNDSGTEDTAPIYGQIDSLNSDGFTLGGGTHETSYLSDSNQTGTNYVAWAWNAGTASAASNTDGNITSSVKANQSAGFSIVTYSASTQASASVGHGLNAVPAFIIAKSRNVSSNWYVWFPVLDNAGKINQTLYLNRTDDKDNVTEAWGHASQMTTSTFGVHPTSGNATNNGNMIAYVYTPIEGFSSFGSYTGNGDTNGNGTYVYTGMRPKFVLIKATSVDSQNWYILDAARDPHNLTANKLEPNTNNTENASPNTATTNSLDLLSNGFKLKTSNDGTNKSNTTYAYAAFAEHPFRTARAR